jgi:hypothetical protein
VTTEAGLMRWLANHGFGSHLVDWLAFVAATVLVLAVRIGARRLVLWLLSHKRGSDKSGKEYWRIHGE